MADSPVRSNMESPDASVLSGKKSRKSLLIGRKYYYKEIHSAFINKYQLVQVHL